MKELLKFSQQGKLPDEIKYSPFRGTTRNKYQSSHFWVRHNYGKATKCENPGCPKQSFIYQWALIEGKEYTNKRENFWQLCTKCHKRYDFKYRVLCQKFTGDMTTKKIKVKISRIHQCEAGTKFCLGRFIKTRGEDQEMCLACMRETELEKLENTSPIEKLTIEKFYSITERIARNFRRREVDCV